MAQLGSARRSGRRGRRFKSCYPDRCNDRCTRTSNGVRREIYRRFADDGVAADTSEVACRDSALTKPTSRPLQGSRATSATSCCGADGSIVMAHPFTSIDLHFSVKGHRTLWWGGCAWDSFAITNLVPANRACLVATTWPGCGRAHAWTVTNEGPSGRRSAGALPRPGRRTSGTTWSTPADTSASSTPRRASTAGSRSKRATSAGRSSNTRHSGGSRPTGTTAGSTPRTCTANWSQPSCTSRDAGVDRSVLGSNGPDQVKSASGPLLYEKSSFGRQPRFSTPPLSSR